MTFPLFVQARMPSQHSLARLRGLSKPRELPAGQRRSTVSSEKGLQDEKLSQAGAASLLVRALQHKGSQTLWKGKIPAPRAWKGLMHTWSQWCWNTNNSQMRGLRLPGGQQWGQEEDIFRQTYFGWVWGPLLCMICSVFPLVASPAWLHKIRLLPLEWPCRFTIRKSFLVSMKLQGWPK